MAELNGALTAYRARQNSMAGSDRKSGALLFAGATINMIAGGVAAGSGNPILAASLFAAGSSLFGSSSKRYEKADRRQAKSRAIESLIMRSRGQNLAAKAYGGSLRLAAGRAAIATAAAQRSVAAMRATPLSTRIAAVKAGYKATGNGLVTSYTRVQNGRSVRVQGYNRK